MDKYNKVKELTGLYYKQTDGGAEYLCTDAVEGTDVGNIRTTVIRVDGTEIFGELHNILRD